MFICFVTKSHAQTVGLVLSGGGAKGAVHIGLIQALEENEIPIDYIGGTSIGAIVGSMYAMGYTPKQMLDLILSEDFYHWQTGRIEEDYYYYFRKPMDTPEFTKFMVPLKSPSKNAALSSILPTNLINPIQMNQAFMALFAQANAVSHGNFNNLMVPFLCISSDVHNKKEIISRSGDLGDAVRASMTFPFVFKPLLKDGYPIYDGGVYDNFPVKPVKDAFNPDFIIGSSVAGSSKLDQSNQSLYGQIESLIMQRTNYQVNPEEGVLFAFTLDDVSLLDFYKAQDLFDLGYKRGYEMADSIKSRLKRTASIGEVKEKRAFFKKSMPELRFKKIIINGVTGAQKDYIESQIRKSNHAMFGLEDFKRAYFKLLADSKIKEIIPHAQYDKDTKCFDLILDVTVNNELMVAFGGNVSSSNANQFYLGLGYQSLTEYSSSFNLDLQVGNTFNGVMFHGRIEPPYKFPVYFKVLGVFNYREYYESEKLFIDNNLLTFMQQRESYLKLAVGVPFLTKGRAEMKIGYGNLEDKYYQSNTVLSNVDYDKSMYNLFSLGVSFEKNTFDAKQYPIKGHHQYIITQYVTGIENYSPGSQYSPIQNRSSETQAWVQLLGRVNNYMDMGSKFNLGYLFETVVSSKNLQSNYTASIMQAPAFNPTPHSKLEFNEAFRANQYLASGLTPIWKINKTLHLRGDAYAFMPLYAIKKGPDCRPYYGDLFKDPAFLGELSFVVQLPFLSVSLYGNYYSFPAKNWNFGLNIGYLIFNPKFNQ